MKQEQIDNFKVDKSSWPRGEWDNEPDRVDFIYKDFPCLILRHDSLGHLCGYVGLPKENQFYKKNYADIPVNVHGELTYADLCDNERVCHVSEENDERYWIGFDFAHFRDVSPGMPNPLSFERTSFLSYKNINYVRKEIESLVDQLIELK